MKKLIIMSALVIGGLGINTANAQFGIHINLHLGNRPVYVPPVQAATEGQPLYNDDYYYLPDVEAYYSVSEQCYYYQDGNRWLSAAYLPGRYHDFDWRYAKRYEIHENRPYMHNDVYRGRFGGTANRSNEYARAYPNIDSYHNNGYSDRDQFNSRGWNNRNRGGFDRHDDRNQNTYNQPQNDNRNGYSQRNQGGYNQPSQQSQNQGGYNGNNQSAQGQQQGNRGNGQGQNQGNSNTQPTNHNGGQNNGNYTGDHYAANKMGVVQDRGEFARPTRN